MKRPLCILGSIVLAAFSNAGAQTEVLLEASHTPLGIIDTIFVSGNETTRPYVILNEMSLQQGSVVTPQALEYDRRRIYSLGLFTRVDMLYDSLGGKHYLLVDVNERWYLFPVPILGFRDGDPHRLFFGAGVIHNNVGGRNQKLFASLVLGYDPSVGVSFLEPLIEYDQRLSLGVGASYSRVTNKSTSAGNFKNNMYDLHASLGKRLGLFAATGISAGFQVVTVSEFLPGRSVSPSGKDPCIYVTGSFTYDTRDLNEYPMAGWFGNLQLTKFGLGESAVDFVRFSTDLRLYVPVVPNFSVAARAAGSAVSGGPTPLYSRAYFGYGDRIRGHFNEISEGEDILVSSLELRWTFVPPFTIFMRELPVPMEFKVWRFGVALAAFVDAGAVWFRNEPLTIPDFRRGQGLGLNFLLPYSYVARIEYAWNERWRGQWILDLRGSF